MHTDIGHDANRTVMTFAGEPDAVIEAAYQAAKTASKLIDMSKQSGTHPRLGAMDVCPLVALKDISIQDLIPYSIKLAKRIGVDLNIPVYMYEHSSTMSHRKRLEQIRKGGYERFSEKMKDEDWKPDYGPLTFNAIAGTTVLGVRDILVAFNVNLATKDVSIANKISRVLRASGYKGVKGKFDHLKAIGWFVEEFDCVQVSTNITNHIDTPAHEVYESIKTEAAKYDVKVTGSELIGLIPLSTMLEAGKFYHPDLSDTNSIIRSAIVGLGLADKKKFNPKERILEYQLAANKLSA